MFLSTFLRSRGRPRLDISVARSVATSNGGECLSSTYLGNSSKLLWRCAAGHRWWASLNNVKDRGSWCTACSREGRRSRGLASAMRLAAERGGECFSLEYKDTKTKLVWQCSEGHVWRATLANVKHRGSWCPHCYRSRSSGVKTGVVLSDIKAHRRCAVASSLKPISPQGAEVQKSPLRRATLFASQRGGQCLSQDWQNSRSSVIWQCSKGHSWAAPFRNMLGRKTFCMACAGEALRARKADEALQIAASRGGQCLNNDWNGWNSEMRWRCACGHAWDASLASIKGGCWCPRCSSSVGEQQVRQILETVFAGSSFEKCWPRFLRRPGDRRGLQLDGYCERIRVAFEFNGEQHYRADCFYNADPRSLDSFEARVRRDAEKARLCREASVRLVVVPHFVPDLWSCVRLQLLGWFPVRRIFPVMLAE